MFGGLQLLISVAWLCLQNFASVNCLTCIYHNIDLTVEWLTVEFCVRQNINVLSWVGMDRTLSP